MKKNKKKILLVLSCILIVALAVGFTMAYLTDNEIHINQATPGEIVTEIVEEFDPPDPEDIVPGGTIQYKKKIQAKNTGKSDSYIRMAVDISDGDVRGESEYSLDGETWYPVNEYKDHLPEGWIFLDDDSLGGAYFYYTKPVKAEKKDTNGRVIQEAELTPPLFEYVRTVYSDEREAYPYDIYAYAEAIQLVSSTGEEFEDGEVLSVKINAKGLQDRYYSVIDNSTETFVVKDKKVSSDDFTTVIRNLKPGNKYGFTVTEDVFDNDDADYYDEVIEPLTATGNNVVTFDGSDYPRVVTSLSRDESLQNPSDDYAVVKTWRSYFAD